jgi:hypothetical protein
MRRIIQTVLLGLAVLLQVPAAGDAQAGGRGGWHGGGRGWHGGGGHGHGWRGGYGPRYYGRGYGGGYYRYGYPRVAIGIGLPGFWWGAPHYAPYYGYGYGWYGPPGYYGPRVVVERPVYVERKAPSGDYWYYCESEGGYYPDVPDCPEEWVRVPPR